MQFGSESNHESTLCQREREVWDYQQQQIDRLKRERNFWEETAAQHCRNEEYYRGLVQKIGETIGEEAYIADDGGKHLDVLCAKVPELVVALKRERDEAQIGQAKFHEQGMHCNELQSKLLDAEAAWQIGWLVWSNEHQAWWRPGLLGYTTEIIAAGRYSLEEALECASSRSHTGVPPEVVVPSPELIAELSGREEGKGGV